MEKQKKELSEAARNARRAYSRRYRFLHPDKVKQWNVAYWERKAQAESAKVHEEEPRNG